MRGVVPPIHAPGDKKRAAREEATVKGCPPHHLWDADSGACRLLIVGPLSYPEVRTILKAIPEKDRNKIGPIERRDRWEDRMEESEVEGTNMIGTREPDNYRDQVRRARFLVENMGVTTLFNINDANVGYYTRKRNNEERKAWEKVCWHKGICSYNPVKIGKNDKRLAPSDRGRGVPDYKSTTAEDIRDFLKYLDVDPTGKIVMHCSAGLGRTGHFVWSVLAYRNMSRSKNPTSKDAIEEALKLVGDKYNEASLDELYENETLKANRLVAIRKALRDLFQLARTGELSQKVETNCRGVFDQFNIKNTREWKHFIKHSTDSGVIQLVRDCYMKGVRHKRLTEATISKDEEDILMQYMPEVIYAKQKELLKLHDGVVGRPCAVGKETVVVRTKKGSRRLCLKPCRDGYERVSRELSGGRVRMRCTKQKQPPKVVRGLPASKMKAVEKLRARVLALDERVEKLTAILHLQTASVSKKIETRIRKVNNNPVYFKPPEWFKESPRSDIVGHLKTMRGRLTANNKLIRPVLRYLDEDGICDLAPKTKKQARNAARQYKAATEIVLDALNVIHASPWIPDYYDSMKTTVRSLMDALSSIVPTVILDDATTIPEAVHNPYYMTPKLNSFFANAFTEYLDRLKDMPRRKAMQMYRLDMVRLRNGTRTIKELRKTAKQTLVLTKSQRAQVMRMRGASKRLNSELAKMGKDINRVASVHKAEYKFGEITPVCLLGFDVPDKLTIAWSKEKEAVIAIQALQKLFRSSCGKALPGYTRAIYPVPSYSKDTISESLSMLRKMATEAARNINRLKKKIARQLQPCPKTGQVMTPYVVATGKNKGKELQRCDSSTLPRPLPSKLRNIIKRARQGKHGCTVIASKYKALDYMAAWATSYQRIETDATNRLQLCTDVDARLSDERTPAGCSSTTNEQYIEYARKKLQRLAKDVRKRVRQHNTLQKPCKPGYHREIKTKKKVVKGQVKLISRVVCVKDSDMKITTVLDEVSEPSRAKSPGTGITDNLDWLPPASAR